VINQAAGDVSAVQEDLNIVVDGDADSEIGRAKGKRELPTQEQIVVTRPESLRGKRTTEVVTEARDPSRPRAVIKSRCLEALDPIERHDLILVRVTTVVDQGMRGRPCAGGWGRVGCAGNRCGRQRCWSRRVRRPGVGVNVAVVVGLGLAVTVARAVAVGVVVGVGVKLGWLLVAVGGEPPPPLHDVLSNVCIAASPTAKFWFPVTPTSRMQAPRKGSLTMPTVLQVPVALLMVSGGSEPAVTNAQGKAESANVAVLCPF